jgi:hypothetical protein
MFSKISLSLAIALAISTASYAQVPDSIVAANAPKKTQTIFGALKPKISTLGLYVAPEFQYLGAAGAYAPATGGSAMLLFNQKLGLGVAAYSAEDFTPKSLNNSALRMKYAYGGGKLEYTFAPHSLLHVSIPLLIGAGMARVDSTNSLGGRNKGNHGRDNWDNVSDNQNSFFVVQPGLRLEANLFRFAKIFVGANYRAVLGTNNVPYPTSATTTANVSNSQLSGLSFSAGVKVGLFDYSLRKKAKDVPELIPAN